MQTNAVALITSLISSWFICKQSLFLEDLTSKTHQHKYNNYSIPNIGAKFSFAKIPESSQRTIWIKWMKLHPNPPPNYFDHKKWANFCTAKADSDWGETLVELKFLWFSEQFV